jgi:hypothetical protein
MLQVLVKLPEGICSIKEKRRIVISLKQRIKINFMYLLHKIILFLKN